MQNSKSTTRPYPLLIQTDSLLVLSLLTRHVGQDRHAADDNYQILFSPGCKQPLRDNDKSILFSTLYLGHGLNMSLRVPRNLSSLGRVPVRLDTSVCNITIKHLPKADSILAKD